MLKKRQPRRLSLNTHCDGCRSWLFLGLLAETPVVPDEGQVARTKELPRGIYGCFSVFSIDQEWVLRYVRPLITAEASAVQSITMPELSIMVQMLGVQHEPASGLTKL